MKENTKKTVLLAMSTLAALLPAASASGTLHDLGTVGTVYEISEPNVLDELKAMAPHIDREKLRHELARYQPKDLHELPKAIENRTFEVDMTYTLAHAVKDASGRIVYPAGFKYNPLRYVGLPGGFVIIDGSDPRQIEWFKHSPYYSNRLARLLLSGGYASELTRKLKRPVYYLTHIIVERFHLQAVPSIVVWDRDKVSVREVKVEN